MFFISCRIEIFLKKSYVEIISGRSPLDFYEVKISLCSNKEQPFLFMKFLRSAAFVT